MQHLYKICVSANDLSASYELLVSGLYSATGQRCFVVINTHAGTKRHHEPWFENSCFLSEKAAFNALRQLQ